MQVSCFGKQKRNVGHKIAFFLSCYKFSLICHHLFGCFTDGYGSSACRVSPFITSKTFCLFIPVYIAMQKPGRYSRSGVVFPLFGGFLLR